MDRGEMAKPKKSENRRDREPEREPERKFRR